MWTVERVAERFREAAQIARRLPPVRIGGYFNTWPAIAREPWERYAAEEPTLRLPPDPAAVDRMLETMGWVLWLAEDERHLVWMRAEPLAGASLSACVGGIWRQSAGARGALRARADRTRFSGCNTFAGFAVSFPYARERSVRSFHPSAPRPSKRRSSTTQGPAARVLPRRRALRGARARELPSV